MNLKQRIADFSTRRYKTITAVLVLLTVIAGLLAAVPSIWPKAFPAFNSVTIDTDPENMLPADNGKSIQFVPAEGDLLFQDSDSSPLCDAIEKVTSGYGGLNITHVGIAAKNENGELIVIEATSKGVIATALKKFLNRNLDRNGNPKVIVGRLKPKYQRMVDSAIKNAFELKGKPYDRVLAIDNGAYYCSELIYEIFLEDNENDPVFELQPMTFNDPATGQTHLVWKDYFSELGIAVPEGRLGINPGGISRSKALNILKKYGNLSKKARTRK